MVITVDYKKRLLLCKFTVGWACEKGVKDDKNGK